MNHFVRIFTIQLLLLNLTYYFNKILVNDTLIKITLLIIYNSENHIDFKEIVLGELKTL